MSIHRDDSFGKATLIESFGGGVEKGKNLEMAIKRELKEELGAEVEIGIVSDITALFIDTTLIIISSLKPAPFQERT